MKKRYYILGITVLAIVGAILIFNLTKSDNNSKAKHFNHEYTLLDDNNVYTYKNITDILKIFESGSGVIFLGIPESEWSQYYAYYLNNSIKYNGINEISYYNVNSIRNNNTDSYKKLVSILKDYLYNNDRGNKEITTPCSIYVLKGKIIGFDNDINYIYSLNAKEYWNQDKINEFYNKMNTYSNIYNGICDECN